MTSSADTEITLGTGKLLFLFFFLVAICALFFALGYSLGRRSEPGIATASAAPAPQTATSGAKPEGGASTQQPSMTFYKAVERKDASSDLAAAPAPDAKSTGAANTASSAQSQAGANSPETASAASGGYFVQVAAVTKQDDADALVDALKKKQYPAFVASGAPGDKLFRVQLGPFADIKDAEVLRTRLIGDGYNPILKK